MKAINTMIIAVIAMIGMTGLAMAGSTAHRYVHATTDIDVSGTGSFSANTWTPDMFDMFNCMFRGADVGYYTTVKLNDYQKSNTASIYRELDANGWSRSNALTGVDLVGKKGQAIVDVKLNGTTSADLKQLIDISSCKYCGYKIDSINVNTGYMQAKGEYSGGHGYYDASLVAGFTNATGYMPDGYAMDFEGHNGMGRYDGTVHVYRLR